MIKKNKLCIFWLLFNWYIAITKKAIATDCLTTLNENNPQACKWNTVGYTTVTSNSETPIGKFLWSRDKWQN